MERWELQTSEVVERADEVTPEDPTKFLVRPNRMHSGNAIVGFYTVYGIFAQPGDPGNGEVDFRNEGISMTPSLRRWLEIAGQRQTGLEPRVERTSNAHAWDDPYTVPMDGSV